MISVVIPTHNRCDLLSRAIRSVLCQTIQDFEIIVVSDGSTDGTDALMQKFEEQDMRIHYISYMPSRNGNYARNMGIKATRGEFVAFLDDDDEWLPTKIEKQINIMSSDKGIGLVYTGTHSIFVDDNIEFDSCSMLQGNMSKRILFDNFAGSTTTVMLRKSVLEKSGLFDESLSAMQDYDLWVRVCQVCKVGVVSEPLVNYYNYNTSSQITLNFEKYEKAYDILNNKYKELYKKLTQKEWKRKIAGQNNSIGMKAHRCNKGSVARRYYKQSLAECFQLKTVLLYIMSYFDYSRLLKFRTYK